MSQTDIAQTIAIVLSLFFSARQIFLLNRTLKLTINSTLAERLDEINKSIFDNPALVSKLNLSHPRKKLSPNDKRPILVDRILNLFNEIYDYKKRVQIEPITWNAWLKTMKRNFHKPFVSGYWNTVRSDYEIDFQRLVDKILETKK